MDTEKTYMVYCLQSTVNPRRTYVGCTNNWERRLRQHNGELVGGARYTRGNRPWAALFHVTNLTRREALQLEWAIKHRRRRTRLATVEWLLKNDERWANCIFLQK